MTERPYEQSRRDRFAIAVANRWLRTVASPNCVALLDKVYRRGLDDQHVIQIPHEPGMVAFEVEILPHDWANDGHGWCKGTGTPQEVADTLRQYAKQAEWFTAPSGNDPQVQS